MTGWKHPCSCSSPGRRWLFTIAAALIALLGMGRRARGADEDLPVQPLRITDQSAELVFEANYLQETLERDGNDQSQRSSNTSLEESLIYHLNAYIYHPRLIDIQSSVKIGQLQQWVERDGYGDQNEEYDSNSTLTGYDVMVQLLKEHMLSGMLYAQQDREVIMEVFTDRQLVESRRWGGRVNWKPGPLPMTVNASRSIIKEYGVDSFSRSRFDVFEYAVRNEIARHVYTDFDYRYIDYEQDFMAENDRINIDRETQQRTHNLNLNNRIYFSRERTSYLNSNLRYTSQSGTSEYDTLQWLEFLNLRLRPGLDNYYRFSVIDNRYEDLDTRTWFGEAGLNHRLYRSLRSHFDVHGRRVEFDGSTEQEGGVTGGLDYRKETPWGVLNAGYSRTLDWIEREGGASQRRVINEGLTLSLTSPAFLNRTGVVVPSVFVTDVTETVVYQEGFDYAIEERGNQTGLRIVPGGRIAEGDAVLVDYTFAFAQDIDYRSDAQFAHVRYDWNGWLDGLATYARWQALDAYDLPMSMDLNVLEFEDWLAGFSYRMRLATWTEEYRQYRSNFSDYDELSSRLEGSLAMLWRMRLNWYGGLLLIDYMDEGFDDDNDTEVLYGGLKLDGRINHNGYWRVSAEARNEDGRVDQTLLGLVANVGWNWRKTHLELGARLEQTEYVDTTNQRVEGFVRVTRELGGWRHK